MHTGPRIAVVRALPGVGDMLCLVPALRSLRRGNPDAQIVLVGLPCVEWMVHRFPQYLDLLLPIGAWPGLPETGDDRELTRRTLARARAMQFDLALQLHGTGWYVNDLTFALGALCNAGYHPPGEYPPTGHFRPWPQHGHEIHRLLDIVRTEGCPDTGDTLEFPALPGDRVPVEVDVRTPFVVVHPGASRPDRRWPARGFAGVVAALAGNGVASVVTGNEAERALAAQVAAESGTDATVLAGATSLGDLAATIRRAHAVVCNDTGVAHLAVAVGTPAIVVVTTSDAARWGPLDLVRNAVVHAGGHQSCEHLRDDVDRIVQQVLRLAVVPS